MPPTATTALGGDPGIELFRRIPSQHDPGVFKYVFAERDRGRLLEVGLYPGGRPGVVHLCVSSQWGCRAGCTFCSTAALKQTYHGDLSVTESQWRTMVDQILLDPENGLSPDAMTEIGFDWMGMGEPGHNLRCVLSFMQSWRPPAPLDEVQLLYRFNTVGVPGALDALAAVDIRPARLKLYISVHAVRDRARLVPHDKIAPLALVLERARAFHARRPELPVALSYLVLPGTNNGDEDARLLAELADPRVFYVRLCSFNAVDTTLPEVHRAQRGEMGSFARLLRRHRSRLGGPPLRVVPFVSRGLDVDLGCGQLCGRLRPGG